jgi:cysteine/O-acetylserine efflux protein
MANLFPFLAYVVVTTFTPGPNNILAMSNAMQSGYRKTLGFLAGMTAGFFVVMMACALFNVLLIRVLPQARFWLNLFGAAYMLYLAVHILRSGSPEDRPESSSLNTFSAGFVLQFLNLKVILYGITVFSMFITQAFSDLKVELFFAPVLAGVGFVSISCWALGGDIFRSYLKKYYRIFNLAMAVLLVYTAIASLLHF